MTGNAAAKCYVVLGRKISAGSGMGAISGTDADLVNVQVHSPHPTLISPPLSNLAW